MRDIHPKINKCSFECASCGAKFEIQTTLKAGSHAIDVCSKCHPFYIGKLSNKQLRGRSEKLSQKFEQAKANMTATKATNKTTTSSRVKKQKANKGLDSL